MNDSRSADRRGRSALRAQPCGSSAPLRGRVGGSPTAGAPRPSCVACRATRPSHAGDLEGPARERASDARAVCAHGRPSYVVSGRARAAQARASPALPRPRGCAPADTVESTQVRRRRRGGGLSARRRDRRRGRPALRSTLDHRPLVGLAAVLVCCSTVIGIRRPYCYQH